MDDAQDRTDATVARRYALMSELAAELGIDLTTDRCPPAASAFTTQLPMAVAHLVHHHIGPDPDAMRWVALTLTYCAHLAHEGVTELEAQIAAWADGLDPAAAVPGNSSPPTR